MVRQRKPSQNKLLEKQAELNKKMAAEESKTAELKSKQHSSEKKYKQQANEKRVKQQAAEKKSKQQASEKKGKQPANEKKGKQPANEKKATRQLESKPDSKIKKSWELDSSPVWYKVVEMCNMGAGVMVMLLMSYYYSVYLEGLHENELWFSNIKEVEREISFRTEQGLYYSYYKQLVKANSLQEGLQELTQDNRTEHGRTINIVQRFNVFQEILLAAVYRTLQPQMAAIVFYVKLVFSLQALYACSVFLLGWSVGGGWLSGCVSLLLLLLNKADATRVHYTVPLRESFSAPFVYTQVLLLGFYIRKRNSWFAETLYIGLMFICCFIACLTWQFGSFILLLQTLAVFGMTCLGYITYNKARTIYICFFSAVLLVWWLQYYQIMLLVSPLMTFLPVALFILWKFPIVSQQGAVSNSVRLVRNLILLLAGGLALNFALKMTLNMRADQHIFSYVKGKLMGPETGDFESRIYLCNEAFKPLDGASYVRLAKGLVLPVYLVSLFFLTTLIIFSTLKSWEKKDPKAKRTNEFKIESIMYQRPELVYHIVHSMLFGLMAASTLRMKLLWTPHVCILAAVSLTDTQLWRLLLPPGSRAWIISSTRTCFCFILIAVVAYLFRPQYGMEQENLKEFWDPDTVALMEWIIQNTPSSAVIAGSMQLMAGVKLCCNRSITNHPHFEDQWLRERTKQVYEVYARLSPERVHASLSAAGATHIALEDSICFASPKPQHCRLVDVIDLYHNHIPEDGVPEGDDLADPDYPRFCAEVAKNDSSYVSLFKPVFSNRTFKVYKLMKVVSS